MAVNPLTPGVYIDEVSVFPPSVAPVATAVPAFIGYTEKGPLMTPTRITSMLDYEQIFGGAYAEQFTATLTGTAPAATIALSGTMQQFTMHYNLRMYFANGGGPCYIVSVDDYFSAPNTPNTISSTKLIDGVNATEKADEVTLLVVPEAIATSVTQPQRAAIHSAQLDLCNKMKDRFSIMDVVDVSGQSIFDDAAEFRNDEVGNNNLKYGAAYYPALDTTLTRSYLDSQFAITDSRTPVVGVTFGSSYFLSDVLSGVAAKRRVEILPAIADGDVIVIAGLSFVARDPYPGSPTSLEFDASGTVDAAATSLAAKINAHPAASLLVSASVNPLNTDEVIITALSKGAVGNTIGCNTTVPTAYSINTVTPVSANLVGGINADITLYNSITALVQANYTMRLYPSSTMAGIYASVDRDRGVWKAPANVSLTGVVAPSVNISAADQEGLNVDAGSGKSINAIRAFAGKGILVWGGRTLAGNDNEWRYINVRRLFIFAEESIAKASEFVVFEPNDANTWSRVRSLISNFLTNLWRDGALAGATPAQAFFVRVGLGETMTAQDILEGKLIIEVGMAAVRPAEFIILKFSHKLQEA